MKNVYDVIIIGCGASGLMAANVLKSRNKKILILDMGNSPARKLAISGGGNCNFTNTNANYTKYFGMNPRFITSALSQFSPSDMLNLIKENNIEFIEKEPGRYFCKNGAKDIVNLLLKNVEKANIKFNEKVNNISKIQDLFIVNTTNFEFICKSIIIASGGVSYPILDVSNIGYMVAKNFGHKIIPIRPALCAIKTKYFGSELSGISLPVQIKTSDRIINDDLLFTHFGLGGPAIYRASLSTGKFIINFVPNIDLFNKLKELKQTNGKKSLSTILSKFIPSKLANVFTAIRNGNIADFKDIDLKNISDKINNFEISDYELIGMQSAEITFGGIDTKDISSKTMESKLCPGLFFAGEVMDINGDLGGFNLQWAFSSGYVAGLNA
ncbi:MAG: aminoacetone oxidase family FAD-binding enzyme [Alphaproteobacteria bacterium]|nr:aminoacetone oxidase family FAD-binding enzyme [Alphaproteobacteria bacterium]